MVQEYGQWTVVVVEHDGVLVGTQARRQVLSFRRRHHLQAVNKPHMYSCRNQAVQHCDTVVCMRISTLQDPAVSGLVEGGVTYLYEAVVCGVLLLDVVPLERYFDGVLGRVLARQKNRRGRLAGRDRLAVDLQRATWQQINAYTVRAHHDAMRADSCLVHVVAVREDSYSTQHGKAAVTSN